MEVEKLMKTLGIAAHSADAGADFYICPDNTAHIVLEQIANDLPIPGLHIAEVVCREITTYGWKHVGLLGTKWTMTGAVYAKALEKLKLKRLIPDEPMMEAIRRSVSSHVSPIRSKLSTALTKFFGAYLN